MCNNGEFDVEIRKVVAIESLRKTRIASIDRRIRLLEPCSNVYKCYLSVEFIILMCQPSTVFGSGSNRTKNSKPVVKCCGLYQFGRLLMDLKYWQGIAPHRSPHFAWFGNMFLDICCNHRLEAYCPVKGASWYLCATLSDFWIRTIYTWFLFRNWVFVFKSFMFISFCCEFQSPEVLKYIFASSLHPFHLFIFSCSITLLFKILF